MGNAKHIALLKQKIVSWNQWREKNPDISPDLSNGKFIGLNLSKANLSNSNLAGAIFTGAKLNRINLSRTNLQGADLSADLSGANLSHADLSYASLINTRFIGAKLRWANFTSAIMHGCVFVGTNLSDVIGLEFINHFGPSTIDLYTIFQSKNNIPASFLHSIGLPNDFIQHIYSYRKNSIMYYSCFISYSSQDEDFVKRLHSDLKNEGVGCWFAPKDMKIGDRIRQTLDDSIQSHEKLLIVLSQNSIDSDWVEKEIETAFEEERKTKSTILLPIMLDDSVMDTDKAWAADIRRNRHIGNFKEWKNPAFYKEAFLALLKALEK